MKMTFQDAVKFFKGCSKEELQRVSEVILSMISGEVSSTNELMVKEREIVCPECGSVHWVRNGHSPTGIQHYKCKDCGKAFSSTTNTILQNTHMPLSTWKKYIECMVVGMSIRKTGDVCGLTIPTVFAWRHKILDAIAKVLEQQKLEGKEWCFMNANIRAANVFIKTSAGDLRSGLKEFANLEDEIGTSTDDKSLTEGTIFYDIK